jgi:hypothetical protein
LDFALTALQRSRESPFTISKLRFARGLASCQRCAQIVSVKDAALKERRL